MREFLILIFTFFIGINSAFAYDLVLPKEKKSIVNTNYAFFIGKASENELLSINGHRVYIASNGAFAHSVKLKEGENRVIIKSNYNSQVYKIYKSPKEENVKPQLVEFDAKLYKVKKDNTPLRSTPIDGGMNRISHLFKDTNIIINGEKGGFYRVYLSKEKEAWIAKNSVKVSELETAPAFITMNSNTFKNASEHIIEFTDKLPYTIEENNEEIIFRVYNPFIDENSVYVVNIKKPEKYTYTTKLNNGAYIFKVCHFLENENRNLDNLTITIDAGHGGSENGAIGCLGDKEKDINLLIAQELKNQLSILGANVVMTRECDGNISLDDRVKLAKENCSDIFVSIHLNSIPDIEMNVHKNRGTSVYYYNQHSKGLATVVENNLTKALNTRKDGVREASFAVIRPTEYIGILVEVAYMTNPIDSVIYKDENFASETAKSIAESILQFSTFEI